MLSGTTDQGSAFKLRAATRKARFRRDRYVMELTVQRPESVGFERGYREHGPVPRRPKLIVVTVTYCEGPRETFVFGQLPAPASEIGLTLADGRRLTADTTAAGPDGSRPFLVSLGDLARKTEFDVRDESGEMLRRDRLAAENPCPPDEGGASFAAQQYEL